ncbi:MAG: tetratricopeptide repeat protein [Gemmatimonadetes bacterium]|nr:tetratricopeptide repeat protein [Gemmatimonadota bacterium]
MVSPPMRIPAALLLIGLLPSLAQSQHRFAEAVTIGKVDSVWSATLKENRPYLVYTPPSYDDTTNTPQKYPVLYILDGDAHFHSVTGLLQILGSGVNGTFVLPPMIVVAIPNTNRTRDMTPTHVETGFDGKPQPFLKTSGGMANFLSFITTELIPKIGSGYRTSGYRVFVGHSLGGITTINALYTVPDAFNAYVAIDPSLWWDKQTLLWKAKSYFSTAKLNGKALYVAQANTINPDDTTGNMHFGSIVQFNGVLETYNKTGLRYGYKYYGNDSHGSVPMIAEYDALRFIFDGYNVDLGRVLATPSLLTEHFRAVSAKLGATFTPSEGMIAQLGQFAMTQDTAKAIELYQIGLGLYPDSYRMYDRLGNAWMAKGDQKKAREFFEQSLAKNPNNQSVKDKLKTMTPE